MRCVLQVSADKLRYDIMCKRVPTSLLPVQVTTCLQRTLRLLPVQVTRCLQRTLCNQAAPFVALLGRFSGNTSRDLSTCQPPAFVFDIDGVLIRGERVLEPAKAALRQLYVNDGWLTTVTCCMHVFCTCKLIQARC